MLRSILGRAHGAPGAALAAPLPIAFAVATRGPDWFFPAMMCVIGGRYLVFQSIYGARIYWACGGVLVAARAGVVDRLPGRYAVAALGMTAATLAFLEFFVEPRLLRHEYLAVYQQFARFYRQEPAARAELLMDA